MTCETEYFGGIEDVHMVHRQMPFYHLALSAARQLPDYLSKVSSDLAEQVLLAVFGNPNDMVFALPPGVA